jgi:hypothetical protein
MFAILRGTGLGIVLILVPSCTCVSLSIYLLHLSPSTSEAKTRFIESKEGEKKAPEKRRSAFVQVQYNKLKVMSI